MWFNSKQRAEPYHPLTWASRLLETGAFSSAGRHTGAAWLSSARGVRCRVKSRNESNPRPPLPVTMQGTLGEQPGRIRGKTRGTSSHPRHVGQGHITPSKRVTRAHVYDG